MEPVLSPIAGLDSAGKRAIQVIVVLVILLLGVVVVESFYQSWTRRAWEKIGRENEGELETSIHNAFAAYQLSAFSTIREIAGSSSLRDQLSKENDTLGIDNFSALPNPPPENMSLELYDDQKELIGWSGNRGPLVDTGWIQRRAASTVLQGPIYSYLVISVPATDTQGQITGYVVGKRLFDVNYPINNRFINNAAFTSTFTAQLHLSVDFDFSVNATSKPHARSLAVPLYDLENKRLGAALVQPVTLEAYLDQQSDNFRKVEDIIFSGILLFAGYVVIRYRRMVTNAGLRLLFLSVLLWLSRYVMIWVNIPGSIVPLEIFTPKNFSSPFGYGLGKSLGDVFLTSIVLFANTMLIVKTFLRKAHDTQATPRVSILKKVMYIVLMASIAFLLYVVIRGFAAFIHSAVYDSAISYSDPTPMIPSTELAVMLLSLFLVSLSLVFLAILFIAMMRRLFERISGKSTSVVGWFTVVLILLLGSILYGGLQQHPLLGQKTRLAIVSGLIICAFVQILLRRKPYDRPGLLQLVLPGLIAIFILVPLLDRKVHELDRTHVETTALELVRPEDSWLTYLANTALDQLSQPEISDLLSSADTAQISNLGFYGWANSILSREGNNCSVTYSDSAGKIQSDFHIGVPAHPAREHHIDLVRDKRSIQREEKFQNGIMVKWYTATQPIFNHQVLVGYVRVELSGGRQTLLRTDPAALLRNETSSRFEIRHRPLILSEYDAHRLISTSSDLLPMDKVLPAGLSSNAEREGNGVWVREVVDGIEYESFYLPEEGDGESHGWLALSMQALDFRWHLYSFLRYVVFYLLAGSLAGVGVILANHRRGKNLRLSFGAKLSLAFIVVSILPVLTFAYYNRQYGRERSIASTDRRLGDQTSVVVAELQREAGINAPVTLARLTDDRCVEIANDLNTDFNVYFANEIQASSKPEMFTAQILDAHLSSGAFVNIVLKKKGFFSETQAIGSTPYVVGYRPLLGENGAVMGVVSVPTLYRQAEMEEDVARRNVFLYGAYTAAILLSVLVGTILANQIALPLRRLKRATAQVAAGELDLEFANTRKDELGELEQAFVVMARDLHATQEQMLKTHRELAWREMAKQVAHEIKNPLTPIKLSVQQLRAAYRDKVENFGGLLEQITTTVLEQIETLSRIASEFSHFARMPERTLEPCSVHDIVREAIGLFQHHRGVTFIMEFCATSPIIVADREELRRAFINIIRNAIQAMEENGNVKVRTAEIERMAAISFIDTGPGIPEELQNKIFEPNFSTKTEGMGLGLAIVRKIIIDLGGTISISSKAGEGTTVSVLLPRS